MTQAHQEPTRIRQQGTHVTNPAQSVDPGLTRIAAVREIVKRGQYAKIDGIMVDLFSASAIIAVYNAINEENQARYRKLHVGKMAAIAFKLTK